MSRNKKVQKDRIDKILVNMNLVDSREKAQKLIIAGAVRVNDNVVDKPGSLVPENAIINIVRKPHPYVSRGGSKLATALDHYKISVNGYTVMDVGVSTGGFTDCLLQRGVSKVYAIDVGYGQLDWKLRNDPRIVLFERTNIRYFSPSNISEKIHMVVIDVSFISLTMVIPPVQKVYFAPILALVKPQFELGKGKVGKGGIVKDEGSRLKCVKKIVEFSENLGYYAQEPFLTPVYGAKGNREYFVYLLPK